MPIFYPVHPIVGIALFLVFTAFVAYGIPDQIFIATLLITVLHFGRTALLKRSWQMLKRLRWLLLSIFFLYVAFTPGTVIFPHFPIEISQEGLALASLRVLALILMVLAVNLLLWKLPTDQLVASVIFLMRPLKPVLDEKRLAIRITLTMELISEVALLNKELVQERIPKPVSGLSSRISYIGEWVSQLFQAVLEKAESMPVREIQLPEKTTLPVIQWLYPLILFALFQLSPGLLQLS